MRARPFGPSWDVARRATGLGSHSHLVAVDSSTLPLSSAHTQPAFAGWLSSRTGRYLVVGAGCTLLDVGLFNLGAFELGLGTGVAKVLSTAVAVLVSYLLNRHWTFGDAENSRSMRIQLMAYVGVNAASALASVVCMDLASAVGFGSQGGLNVAAYGAVLTIGTAARYTVYRRWLFA
jgi:putative flippase GtrA